MAALQELLVRIGVDIAPFSDGLSKAIAGLDSAGQAAVRSGNQISKAFSALGISDAAATMGTQAKQLQAHFENLERAYKNGRITAEDYAKAQQGLKQRLQELQQVNLSGFTGGIKEIDAALKALGVNNAGVQVAQQADKLRQSMSTLDSAFKAGKLSAEDYRKAQAALNTELAKLGSIKIAPPDIKTLSDRLNSLGQLGDKLKNIGTALTAGITLPLAGVAAASVKMAGDFEQSMNRVEAMGDMTAKELQELEAVAMKLGADTKFSAKEAADGMGELAQAGFSASQIITAMPTVLDLAAAGQMKVAQAAEVAKNMMGQFGISASGLQHAMDVVAKAAASGNQSIQDMALTFEYVGPLAKQAGLTLEQTAAAVTLMADAGLKGEKAGTGMRAMFAKLLDPSKEAAAAISALGLNITTAEGKLRPFGEVLQELGKKANALPALFKLVGSEAATAVQAMINGRDKFEAMTQSYEKADGALKKMADTLQKGMAGAWEKTKGSIETAGIAIGKSLAEPAIRVAGVIESLANKVASLAQAFATMPKPLQNIAMLFTGLAVAIGPVVFAVGAFAASLNSIHKTVGLVGTVLADLGITFGGAGTAAATLAKGVTAAGAAAEVAAPLLALVGTAIAAWAIDNALTKIEELELRLDHLYAAADKGIKATSNQAREIEVLTGILAKAAKELGAGVKMPSQYDELGFVKPISVYIDELRQAVKELDAFKGKALSTYEAIKQGGAVLERGGTIDISSTVEQFSHLEGAVHKTSEQIKSGTISIKGAIEQYGHMGTAAQAASDKSTRSGAQVVKTLNDAAEAGKKAKDAIGDALKTLGLQGTDAQMGKSAGKIQAALATLEKAYKSHAISAQDWARVQLAAFAATEAAAEQTQKSFASIFTDSVMNTARNAIAVFKELGPALSGSASTAVKDLVQLAEGLQRIVSEAQAVKSISPYISSAVTEFENLMAALSRAGGAQQTLAQRVQEAESDYEALSAKVGSYGVTAQMVHQSLITMIERQIQLQQALGDTSEVERLKDVLQAAQDAGISAADALEGAIRRVGGTTIAELDRAAQQAAADYDRIAQSGVASADTVKEAKIRAIRAEMDAIRAHGTEVTDEDRKRLKTLEGQLDVYMGKTKARWRQLTDEIKSILQGFNRAVGQILFNNLLFGNSSNDALKEQEQELLASLEKRKQAWEEYQADIQRRMQQTRDKYADELARGTADLNKELEKAREEYEEYAAEVSEQLARIRKEHAEQLAAEVADIKKALAEKEKAYEEYAAEVSERLAQIRAENAESLAKELNDLKDELAERTAAYQDYVSDVNERLSKIRKDTADNIADKEQDVSRNIADKQKEYDREVEDTKKKIARLRAENKEGSADEIADLELALKRKEEDLQQYVSRQIEDLAKYRKEQQERLKEEENDISKSLAQRKKEHDDYVAKNLAKQKEAVEQHKKDLEEQERDLNKSLAQRRKELEKARQDAAKAIDETTAKHAKALEEEEKRLATSLAKRAKEFREFEQEISRRLAELQKQSRINLEIDLAALQKELDDARVEYEQFVADTNAQLARIRDAMVTVGEQVVDAFKGMLADMGAAVFAWGAEIIQGYLIGLLKDLMDNWFPKVAEALKSIFGQLGGFITDALKGIWGALSDFLGSIGGKLADILRESLGGLGEHLKEIFSGLWGALKDLFQGLGQYIWDLIDGIGKQLIDVFETLGKTIWDVLTSLAGVLQSIWDKLKGIFTAMPSQGDIGGGGSGGGVSGAAGSANGILASAQFGWDVAMDVRTLNQLGIINRNIVVFNENMLAWYDKWWQQVTQFAYWPGAMLTELQAIPQLLVSQADKIVTALGGSLGDGGVMGEGFKALQDRWYEYFGYFATLQTTVESIYTVLKQWPHDKASASGSPELEAVAHWAELTYQKTSSIASLLSTSIAPDLTSAVNALWTIANSKISAPAVPTVPSVPSADAPASYSTPQVQPSAPTVNVQVGTIRGRDDVDYLVNQMAEMGVRI